MTSTGRAPSAGCGGREGGEVAGGVADAGGARGEGDPEGADVGVGGACALGDRERGDGGGDGGGRVVAAARDVRQRPGGGAGAVGGERLGEGGERAVDLAVEVDVLHDQGREHRSRPVDRGGGSERGLVAGGVADAGGARCQGDPEGADGGVEGARALCDGEGRARPGGRDRCQRAAAGDGGERPGSGVRGGGEGLGEGGEDTVDPAVVSTSRISSVPVTSTGRAPSVGAEAAKEARLPAASRMPVALVASATRKAPTSVSGAPAPSAIVSVAMVVATVVVVWLPPLGTFVSVQGAAPAL